MQNKVQQNVSSYMANKASGYVWKSPWIRGGIGDPGINISPGVNGQDSQQDWFYALNRVDYRVSAYRSAPDQITYSVEFMKYYSFDQPFAGLSRQDLDQVVAQGRAQSFYVIGTTDPMTMTMPG